ncbi:MAG TPA: SRPBCC family protein [Opitutaceae bacterium]
MSAGLGSDPARVCDIVSERVFAAPRERVFRAFSEPEHLARWWGPAGFTNTFLEFDFRSGGVWRFTMRGPDGAAYAMDHRFTEVVAPERIVVRHLQQGHDFTLTITLADRAGRTEVAWRMVFDDPEEAARVRSIVVPANEQNLERLAALLAGLE